MLLSFYIAIDFLADELMRKISRWVQPIIPSPSYVYTLLMVYTIFQSKSQQSLNVYLLFTLIMMYTGIHNYLK